MAGKRVLLPMQSKEARYIIGEVDSTAVQGCENGEQTYGKRSGLSNPYGD
jgi:hypothetical protein